MGGLVMLNDLVQKYLFPAVDQGKTLKPNIFLRYFGVLHELKIRSLKNLNIFLS